MPFKCPHFKAINDDVATLIGNDKQVIFSCPKCNVFLGAQIIHPNDLYFDHADHPYNDANIRQCKTVVVTVRDDN